MSSPSFLSSIFGITRYMCDFQAVNDDLSKKRTHRSSISLNSASSKVQHDTVEGLNGSQRVSIEDHPFRVGDRVMAPIEGEIYDNMKIWDIYKGKAYVQYVIGPSETNPSFRRCKWVWLPFDQLEMRERAIVRETDDRIDEPSKIEEEITASVSRTVSGGKTEKFSLSDEEYTEPSEKSDELVHLRFFLTYR